MPNRSCTSVHSHSNSPTAQLDSQDQIDATSAKLSSLLAMLSGEGFDSFKNMADEHKQNLLWLASELADDIVCLGKMKAGDQPQ